jgi:ketosteroid isomerase-like protein
MRWFESSRPSMSPVLRALLDAFERGDLAAAAACFADDASYREARHDAMVGRAAIGALFERWMSSGVQWRFTVDEVIEDGGRACVVYRFAVRKGDGESWRERAGCATVRFGERGSIAEWREYEG